MEININKDSGFCFGVVRSIASAEEHLVKDKKLYCLGDIVHNNEEVKRLEKLGLKIINYEQYKKLTNSKVLLRAHGEPPKTYEIAKKNNIKLIDASCPVVLKLQERIKKVANTEKDAQVLIYGKKGHPEIKGLVGQTNKRAIIIEDLPDLDKITFGKKIKLFSQTTKSLKGYKNLIAKIRKRINPETEFDYKNTICRAVSNRVEPLIKFSKNHDIIIFVSGKKSSNGKQLFQTCLQYNPRTYFISNPEELNPQWFKDSQKVGICGATSTPQWLMQNIKQKIITIIPS